MACCVIAAFIFAQFMATLRRWGVFWGLVKPEEYDAKQTAFTQLRGFLASTRGRQIVRAAAALEFVLLAGWVYTFHGEHLYELADVGFSRIEGKQVIYADRCDTAGGVTKTRIVLEDIGS